MKNDNFSFNEAVRDLSEKVRLQATRPNIYGYKPHDKQVAFHAADGRNRLYIGGNRSGKTTAGIADDIWWCMGKHPYRQVPDGGVRGRIVGVDFTYGVEKILKPEFMRWCPVSLLRGGTWSDAYDSQERTLHFENGSFVEFMSYDQDVDKFAGTSRHFIHFDEEPPQDIFIECRARLVDTKGSWWMTLTPVQGMIWMFDEIYTRGNDPSSNISVIEVDTFENPYLDDVEINEFLKDIPEEDRDARLHGKFVRRGGVIYKQFKRQIHVIDPLDKIPDNWEVYNSMDHGFNNPTAWLWHAVDPDGNVITFAEHYEREMIIEDHAKQVKMINGSIGHEIQLSICDPACSQRNAQTGTSVMAEYSLHGVYMTPGNNDVISGINKINAYLSYNTKLKPPRLPRWHITSNCVNLLAELPKYRWKTWSNKKSERENNPYDVPHKKDDHACDAARYFFTIMPDLTPVKQEELWKPPEVTVLDPRQPVYDKKLQTTPPQGDWFTQEPDQYIGGFW